MIQVNVFEMKARLSEYLDRVIAGERIVVCRHNKPVAELRAIESVRREPRRIGPLSDRPRFDLPPSFFEPLSDDELDAWEGVTSGGPPTAGQPTSAGRRTSRAAASRKGHTKSHERPARRRS